jgi:hypothetical protein
MARQLLTVSFSAVINLAREVLDHHLTDLLIVRIRGQYLKTMFHGAGGDPNIVSRDGSSRLPEGIQNNPVSVSGFFGHVDNIDPR